ncbi:hypothetical protein PCNPT3_02110 [Psychromonas sp. CNPT3]|uniref:TapY2 family type IVa secretion system protein n=1 Tax=Psychromonas sp. CNPT3 TaxID=314282 RepID=UPI0002C0C2BB|nr:TapY2 family type IVa secretion system protein [Psychromonas sp. CNPT3]AGH80364.1 hypothetical protein PCNPT3_02110 [Psychromonas sp. CNPT3]
MRIKKILFGLFILLLSTYSFAEPKPRETLKYKCYVQLEDQSKVIREFNSVIRSSPVLAKSLLGEKVYFSDGVSSSNVIHVMECVLPKHNFIGQEAFSVSKKTKF